MNNARDEMDQFLSLWSEAQHQFTPEKKAVPKKKKQNSYYGMENTYENLDIEPEEEEHWRDVYFRSLEIDADELLTDNADDSDIDAQCLAGMMDVHEAKAAKKAAAEKKTAKKTPKKKKTDRRKPQEDDASDEDDAPDENDEDGFGKDLAKKLGDTKFNVNPLHFASVGADASVSPNVPLRVTPNFTDGNELRQLARLKSLLYDLESEMLGTDVRGGDPEPIRVKMLAVRKQCESLSQKLIPDPKTDVS